MNEAIKRVGYLSHAEYYTAVR